ncbi:MULTISPECIES: TetR/AcrR family transcriptional regulator [Massilia]|jgi:AcrR family transcriptional regulator|uniref:TetR/AcrR family transcriptional regulator n=1 Tax=Massilia TaxID=149698 RepID=UPI001C62C671|nr:MULTISPECIES: TetR/AcrR family transcriptional regulator [Massilia]QYG02886.1 TetR/AcrR family transcriptional regulator; helix-turn-helix transcriptional regulator [Massilia sp. NP310]
MNHELSNMPALTRSYRGQSQEQRRAERRARLIEGAIAVYGERGYHQATVKAVCEAAGLTERYFYESFANSEALLIDSYNTVTYAVLGEILRAGEAAGRGRVARSRAMLHAYFAALQREPQSARVFLVEIRGVSRAVDQAFDTSLRAIGRDVARLLDSSAANDELLQAGVIGGVIHIALRWIEDGYQPPIERAVETALRLGTALAAPPRRRVRPA